MDTRTKKTEKEFFDILPQAITRLKKNIIEPFFGESNNGKNNGEENPLRSEIFTRDRLVQHAVTLAKRHAITHEQAPEKLLKRLAENEFILFEVHSLLTEAVKQNNRISPAAEWLLDNFYLIEEQIYTGKKHLPKGYSKALPRLSKGDSANLPRVYDMAVEIISHSDGYVDITGLTDFINSYQTITNLKIGELWAIPIMLRLALLENLRRLSIIIAEEISNKELADKWADQMIDVAEKTPKDLVLVIADMARSDPPMESTFVAEFTRRLQEKGSLLSLPLKWIEERLAEIGVTISELIQVDNQSQAATQVSVSNSINSFRFLSAVNWRDFVEETSVVEKILRQDINGVYGKMDFYTRDHYRHAIEKIAYAANKEEYEIAQLVLNKAKQHFEKNSDPKLSHVGFYLTGRGYAVTTKEASVKNTTIDKCRRAVNKKPLLVYLGSIFILSILICWALLEQAASEKLDIYVWIAVSLAALIATTKLAVSIVNWLVTILARPCFLPRMDFSKGISAEAKTMVVIPTLISDIEGIIDLVEGLEVRFLANRDANLYFALLTDFKDAKSEHLPEDTALVLAVKSRIIELNRKYQRETNDTFFLFHRPRKWNRKDKIWMGFERKRGKLSELNALLRGTGEKNFMEIVGEPEVYKNVRYVITLDTDTQLPRDTAWKMAGTMSHLLNHPVYSEKKKRVVEGYSILQPRVSTSLPLGNTSLYARLHTNDPGTDPYTKVISDVYQDLFGEGSFIGKGIYDIDAFETALKDRFPENRILSHDLLEGCYARSGLVTDVQLYEEYPLQYQTDMLRRHRWIRGDWQIARWILPYVPGADKSYKKNRLTLFSRWKIFDNIRRSLVPPSLLFLLLFGWVVSSAAWFWTLTVTIIIFLPSIINFLWQLYKKPPDALFTQHLAYTLRSGIDNFIEQLLDMTFLPYEAYSSVDAILRTLWRMSISKRNLLQWNPFSSIQNSKSSVFNSYKRMWFSPVLSVLLYAYLTFKNPGVILIAVPFFALWIASPAIAYIISLPFEAEKLTVSSTQRIYLRKLTRKIWAFFEHFVNAQHNWLPPDNHQENPVERTAHRTSPTNLGLSLLANLTAYDFGYIPLVKLVERTGNTIDTMMQLKKFRGHLYNWYDTITLEPLFPRYISTVDSGNLAGHLIVLKQGLLSIPEKKLAGENFFEGLIDTISVLIDYSSEKEVFIKLKEEIEKNYHSNLDTLERIKNYIEQLEITFGKILRELDIVPHAKDDVWAQKVSDHLHDQKNSINSLAPWLFYANVPEKFTNLLPELPAVPTLKQIALIEQLLLQKIVMCYQTDNSAEENEWLNGFRTAITDAAGRAKELILTIEQLASKCMVLGNIEYDFLYDKSQKLLSIGYNAEEHRRDNSYYDLLASEARLTTYLGIAQGKLPQESWFALGRQLTSQGTAPVLVSWSGSMFEYLMPQLVMPSYENTLLDQTSKSIIQKQIEYGKKRSVPWGISESGYNMLDANLNYQYKAFGVPGIGLKRGLGEDLVISPYSTIMALMVAPNEAYKNLQVLRENNLESDYGFYEAVDYTPSRLPRRKKNVLIQSYMIHHQGMSFLALSYLLLNKPMQQRFESEVHLKSALLLLQERIPRVASFYSPRVHTGDTSIVSSSELPIRVVNTPNTPVPEIQLLSNGRYNVVVTNSGGGYSRWKNLAVTRWREDTTCDNWGSFCYIRDLESKIFWSSAYQPTLQQPENYEAVFSQGRAEFRRRDFSLETHTEIVVSPEDDIELRRVHITNRSRKKRLLEITSYAEVVIIEQAADEAHPAFSNLFVQTEINEVRNAITCTRRPRSIEEKPPWMFHLMKVHDANISDISYETDRSLFIGRGNSIIRPMALMQAERLSGTSGAVLDPIVSIQYRIVLEGNESATIDIITGLADTKDVCDHLIEKYQERYLFNRVLELALTHSSVILRQINALEPDAQLYSKLAGSIIFSSNLLRSDPSVIIKNRKGQSGLWAYSISGDIPIVLVQIEDSANIDLVKQMIQAHLFWRLKGLTVDLVIWNDDRGGYRQELNNQIHNLVAPGIGNDFRDKPGGIFIRSMEQISNEDRILFESVANIIIADKYGTLEEQINRRIKTKTAIPYFSPTKIYPTVVTEVQPKTDLEFFNGYGGFTRDGKEYIITTTSNIKTPAPWINVLANANFGSIVSESGQSYTWVDNAHEIRLSPWNNDPVNDLKGEAFYLKDEESGRIWAPAPLPCKSTSSYITRHGFGYSVFEHTEDGIFSEMTVFTDIQAPVKYVIIKFKNHSGRPRNINATGYVEWVLGDLRGKYMKHTVTMLDDSTGALMATNAYSSEFVNRVAFFDADGLNKNVTTDRTEFIGRNGTMANPDGLNRVRLSGKTGAALDPCAVIQVGFSIGEEEEHEVIFRLGAGKDYYDAQQVIRASEGTQAAHAALQKVYDYWNNMLGVIHIDTQDTALNMLTNGWLNYQTLASRIYARSGFYQSGGAFGFRDQLQDVLSLIHSQPQLVRSQIILSASRQFKEGDVQHWWHPPSGRGVRTTCSDDYLWLPYVTAKYVKETLDKDILDEQVSFIEGRLLNAGEESYYDLPIHSDITANVYKHCVKSIEHGLRFGEHGLPLIGSGDWNDGMDKVGVHGKGESVWLAFFLYDILIDFAEVAMMQSDNAFVIKCKNEANKLKKNIEEHTWDGDWYRRAYFDDGTPLGSKENDECKIDSIAQSWSVLSEAGTEEHTIKAMSSAYNHLVQKNDQLIQLFNPPFDKSKLNPGYIKGYVPGVRENGGQYTHAAIWLIMAYAHLGDKKTTWELLQMINPVNKGNSKNRIDIYKTEPYVIAADVYKQPNHRGRGGWTWYTGSAGWMYQLIIHSFIGLKREGNTLHFNPCIPAEWDRFSIKYRFLETNYHIHFNQSDGEKPTEVFEGDIQLENGVISLVNDNKNHEVRIELSRHQPISVHPKAH